MDPRTGRPRMSTCYPHFAEEHMRLRGGSLPRVTWLISVSADLASRSGCESKAWVRAVLCSRRHNTDISVALSNCLAQGGSLGFREAVS